jgi:hypothetical protein
MIKHSLIALALAACGGGNSPHPDAAAPDAPANAPAVVNGNLGGAPFVPRDAIWTTDTADGFDFNGMSTILMITDFPNACANQMSGTGVPDGRLLMFVLGTTDATGASLPITQPGAYTVFTGTAPASSKLAEPYFEIDDAHCLRSAHEFGASGTVTVGSATDPQMASFDVAFDNGDHVTGSYRATMCSALDVNRTPTNGCPP